MYELVFDRFSVGNSALTVAGKWYHIWENLNYSVHAARSGLSSPRLRRSLSLYLSPSVYPFTFQRLCLPLLLSGRLGTSRANRLSPVTEDISTRPRQLAALPEATRH